MGERLQEASGNEIHGDFILNQIDTHYQKALNDLIAQLSTQIERLREKDREIAVREREIKRLYKLLYKKHKGE